MLATIPMHLFGRRVDFGKQACFGNCWLALVDSCSLTFVLRVEVDHRFSGGFGCCGSCWNPCLVFGQCFAKYLFAAARWVSETGYNLDLCFELEASWFLYYARLGIVGLAACFGILQNGNTIRFHLYYLDVFLHHFSLTLDDSNKTLEQCLDDQPVGTAITPVLVKPALEELLHPYYIAPTINATTASTNTFSSIALAHSEDYSPSDYAITITAASCCYY